VDDLLPVRRKQNDGEPSLLRAYRASGLRPECGQIDGVESRGLRQRGQDADGAVEFAIERFCGDTGGVDQAILEQHARVRERPLNDHARQQRARKHRTKDHDCEGKEDPGARASSVSRASC